MSRSQIRCPVDIHTKASSNHVVEKLLRERQCFSYLQAVEKSFFEGKKSWKNTYFSYDPNPYPGTVTVPVLYLYSSRDGENMLSSCHFARRKNPQNPRENCVAYFEYCAWRLETRRVPAAGACGGCLRRPPPQAPARAQSPTRNTRIKRRNFRADFCGYSYSKYFDVNKFSRIRVFYLKNVWFGLKT